MPRRPVLACFSVLLLVPLCLLSQRNYRPSSILSAGSFYQLGVDREGVYRIDIPLLNTLGINTSNIPSSSIRLFGNGGRMLAESNAGPWLDDLQENSILVLDGGDGLFNGSDMILFYSTGPDIWQKDSMNQRFIHQKNLYTDKAFYFLSIGGTGNRVLPAPVSAGGNVVVNSFSERNFHEKDTVNFLSSGKEWYGEEFASMPGKTTVRDFNFSIPDLVPGSVITVSSQMIARSVGAASRFDIRVNGGAVAQYLVGPVAGGIYDLFAQQTNAIVTGQASGTIANVNYNFSPGSFNAQGWLNWIEVFSRRQLLLPPSGQLPFRDWSAVGVGNIAEYQLANSSASTIVWEVTEPLQPLQMNGSLSNGIYRFTRPAERLREFIAFNPANAFIPIALGKVTNQDLHNASAMDYLLITYPAFTIQAQRLADFHRNRGLRTLVATTTQIFNEFGSGKPDPVAIRDFLKMYHDKFSSDPASRLKYVLLFGDASFDYRDRISNNTNYVPAWEHSISLDPLATYASDDFFGFLDDNEDINSSTTVNYLDAGIGRVPAKNADEAKQFVDKVLAYHSPAAMGPWRSYLTFIADDEDFNLHLQDAEIFTATVSNALPAYNIQKIYLDAYLQESGAGGSRYPQANLAIDNQVFNGTLIWNYTGHGGARRLAEETILDQEIVNRWNNPQRLPLFITATCDFAPYDNPLVPSIGENILVRPKTGGIALMTTTRVVFAFSNRIMNDNYLRIALQRDATGKFKTLGDAMKDAKNYTYQTSADVTNNRKFTLLGDPAMTLAFPAFRVKATSVNGVPVTQADTLSATENVVIEGEVTDLQGNLLPSFNGTLYPTVFDKPQTITTRANDPTSLAVPFQLQSSALFKGKASVLNGRFSFSFKVPKDINLQHGNGKLSLYADDGNADAYDAFNGFIIGGTGTGGTNDNKGPEIKAFLNDEQFVNGGITNEDPVLLLKLFDSSGINTAGTGIGHDLIATLDNDNNQFFILNDFYQSDLDSYQSGIVRFQLPQLSPGPHSLRIKAWDVMNNSSEVIIEFNVVDDGELELRHVLNYPNPFTTKTVFMFEHNKPGQDLQVRVQVFTVTGRIIKMLQQTINNDGTRSSELEWDGKDEYGDKVGRGVYLYRLSVTAAGGVKKEKIEKLVIF
jgi:hypothetical protein